MTTKPTGYYDSHGIPIHVGDLIRVKHFKHCRNRRQMWIYFRVAVHPKLTDDTKDYSRYVVQNWYELDASKWQCLLKDCGIDTAEVLNGFGMEYNERGYLITFNERKRLKPVKEKSNA